MFSIISTILVTTRWKLESAILLTMVETLALFSFVDIDSQKTETISPPLFPVLAWKFHVSDLFWMLDNLGEQIPCSI